MSIGEGAPQRLSKYAQKIRDEEMGVRTPFQFKDSKEKIPEKPISDPITEEANKEASEKAEALDEIFEAEVVRLRPHHMCAFLKSRAGEEIFLSLRVLKRDLKKSPPIIDVGWMIKCSVRKNQPPAPPGLSVSHVLAAISPDGTIY